jgi:hypothetical protein
MHYCSLTAAADEQPQPEARAASYSNDAFKTHLMFYKLEVSPKGWLNAGQALRHSSKCAQG